jgi:hypothetical protein
MYDEYVVVECCDGCGGQTNREPYEPYCWKCADDIHNENN